MGNEPTRRRACLLGLAALIAAPATAAAAATRRQFRAAPTKQTRVRGRTPAGNAGKQAAAARPAPSPGPRQPPPRGRAPVEDARGPTAERGAAPAARPPAQPWPRIDGPPPPSRRPGWDAAPVPNGDALPPIGERRSGPGVSLGVPAPPLLAEGQSFRRDDPAPQVRQQGGARLPSPGATVRLPF